MSPNDDAFKSAARALAADTKDPEKIDWPKSLQWLPCSKWTRHHWSGASAIFAGACI